MYSNDHKDQYPSVLWTLEQFPGFYPVVFTETGKMQFVSVYEYFRFLGHYLSTLQTKEQPPQTPKPRDILFNA